MTQYRVECECGFEEQSAEMKTRAKANQVMNNHQQNCDKYVTIWKAVHSSRLM